MVLIHIRFPPVVLCRFGTVDDVVTFPGRMYAFVNYRTTEEAVLAFETLQDQQVADLTGECGWCGEESRNNNRKEDGNSARRRESERASALPDGNWGW